MTDTNKQVPLSRLIALCACARRAMRIEKMSLQNALDLVTKKTIAQEKSAVQSILYTCVRHHAVATAVINALTSKKPASPYYEVLEVAISLILADSYAPFVIVDQAVESLKTQSITLKSSPKLANFLNGVLRNFLRNKDSLCSRFLKRADTKYNVPKWWLEKIQSSHPYDWETILRLQVTRPPLTLRVNTSKTSVKEYIKLLESKNFTAKIVGQDAITIAPTVNVQLIPGFNEGLSSVQDAGAQLAAQILPLKKGDKLLDACAAPGGKTAHMLEKTDCNAIAIDIDENRVKLVQENLDRLGLQAKLIAADAADLKSWWDGEQFDAILLDAPCTSSGVVRRLPDVPWSRTLDDIKSLAKRQSELLDALWNTLKIGGHLLFATCSIFPEEGINQISTFIRKHEDAKIIPIFGKESLTLLPQEDTSEFKSGLPTVHDGFFYALIQKASQ